MPLTAYMSNSLLDWLLRGVPFDPPEYIYVGLFTTTPTGPSDPGVEVSGNAYARGSIGPRSLGLDRWSGTQGPGTTGPSTGTSGVSFNNLNIGFPIATGWWGYIQGAGFFDAPTGGNLLAYASVTRPADVNAGPPASAFESGELSFGFS
jgi:hypothetical protein